MISGIIRRIPVRKDELSERFDAGALLLRRILQTVASDLNIAKSASLRSKQILFSAVPPCEICFVSHDNRVDGGYRTLAFRFIHEVPGESIPEERRECSHGGRFLKEYLGDVT